MIQRLPMALAQEKQVAHQKTYWMKSGKSYFPYEEEVTKKAYNNISNSIKL